MLLIRILLLSLALCNIAEVQASVGSSVAWSLQLEYDLMGRESLRRLLGGVESRTRYDRSGHVTDQVTQGVGYEVSHRSYDWDLSGKLRKLTAGSYTAEFDYDVVGTLAAARYNETDILYKLPDRFAKEARYERGGRRKEDKEWTYHFDEEGFLTQRVSKAESIERYDWIRRKLLVEPLTWTYEWDGAEQLVRVKNNKKVNLRFEYDALGRRVAKINEYGKAEGHKITRFLWDGNVPLHEWSYSLSERPETIDDSGLSKERVLHVVTTHLRINLQEARSGFDLFGRHSYTTVLVMKILNVNGIRNGQSSVHLGYAVQWSLSVERYGRAK